MAGRIFLTADAVPELIRAEAGEAVVLTRPLGGRYVVRGELHSCAMYMCMERWKHRKKRAIAFSGFPITTHRSPRSINAPAPQPTDFVSLVITPNFSLSR